MVSTAAARRQHQPADESPIGRTARPERTRVVIDSTPTRLEIDLPPLGLSGYVLCLSAMCLKLIAELAYSATMTALTHERHIWGYCYIPDFGYPFIPLIIVFLFFIMWARTTLVLALRRQRLEIQGGSYRVANEYGVLEFRFTKWLVECVGVGKVLEWCLSGSLAPTTTTRAINKSPRLTTKELMNGSINFGAWLDTQGERDWVAGEINAWLTENCGTEVLDVEAASPAPLLQVVQANHQPLSGDDRETDRFLHEPLLPRPARS